MINKCKLTKIKSFIFSAVVILLFFCAFMPIASASDVNFNASVYPKQFLNAGQTNISVSILPVNSNIHDVKLFKSNKKIGSLKEVLVGQLKKLTGTVSVVQSEIDAKSLEFELQYMQDGINKSQSVSVPISRKTSVLTLQADHIRARAWFYSISVLSLIGIAIYQGLTKSS